MLMAFACLLLVCLWVMWGGFTLVWTQYIAEMFDHGFIIMFPLWLFLLAAPIIIFVGVFG